jgi:hypothetical protein
MVLEARDNATLAIRRSGRQRRKDACPSLREVKESHCKLRVVKWSALGTLHVSSLKSNEQWLRRRRGRIGHSSRVANDIRRSILGQRSLRIEEIASINSLGHNPYSTVLGLRTPRSRQLSVNIIMALRARWLYIIQQPLREI